MAEENKVSKAQQKAVNKYVKNNYDRINVTFPKGQKAILQAAAKAAGESLNGYIKKAIDERMEREPLTDQPNSEAAEEKATKEEVNPVPESKEKKYKPFTAAEEANIDFERLRTDIHYQVDIANFYGDEVVSKLLDKARGTLEPLMPKKEPLRKTSRNNESLEAKIARMQKEHAPDPKQFE